MSYLHIYIPPGFLPSAYFSTFRIFFFFLCPHPRTRCLNGHLILIMRLYLLAIFLSSRAVKSGPLIFGDSTLSEPDGLSTVDGGNPADTGQVMELPLESSQWNHVDVLPNNRANDLTDYQIPDSTNNGSPNLLADLPVAACLDGKSQVKGSATKNENSCPAPLDTSPSGQSTDDSTQQQQDSGNKPNPDEKKDDQPVVDTNPFDNICEPPKRLFCCFGPLVPNWNSRQGCEECMLSFYIFFSTVSP